jgi:hypothetical protein
MSARGSFASEAGDSRAERGEQPVLLGHPRRVEFLEIIEDGLVGRVVAGSI